MPFNQASDKVWPITHPDGSAFQTDGTDMNIDEQVGKYYGERYVGGVAGVTCATSGEGRMVWEFDHSDFADAETKELKIPEGFARITSVIVEITEAFGAGDTVEVENDGTTVTSAALSLATVGTDLGAMVATDATVTVVAGDAVTIATTGITSTTGRAKVIAEFTRA